MSYNRSADLLSRDISSKRLRTEIPIVGVTGWSPVITIEETGADLRFKVTDWVNTDENADATTKPVLGVYNYVGETGYTNKANAYVFNLLQGVGITYFEDTYTGGLDGITGADGEVGYVADTQDLYIWGNAQWNLAGSLVVDVTGKVDKITSTANAIALFNNTTGDLKNSGVTIAPKITGVLDSDLQVPTSAAVREYVLTTGTVTTGNNAGTLGYGVYVDKVSNTLRFANIANSTYITLNHDVDNNNIIIGLDVTNIPHDLLSGAQGHYSHTIIDAHIDARNNPHSTGLAAVTAVSADAGGVVISNLADPVNAQDATTKSWVEDLFNSTTTVYYQSPFSWNMNDYADETVSINYTGTQLSVKSVDAVIVNDARTISYPITTVSTKNASTQGGIVSFTTTGVHLNVKLFRATNGTFDKKGFENALVIIKYVYVPA